MIHFYRALKIIDVYLLNYHSLVLIIDNNLKFFFKAVAPSVVYVQHHHDAPSVVVYKAIARGAVKKNSKRKAKQHKNNIPN